MRRKEGVNLRQQFTNFKCKGQNGEVDKIAVAVEWMPNFPLPSHFSAVPFLPLVLEKKPKTIKN